MPSTSTVSAFCLAASQTPPGHSGAEVGGGNRRYLASSTEPVYEPLPAFASCPVPGPFENDKFILASHESGIIEQATPIPRIRGLCSCRRLPRAPLARSSTTRAPCTFGNKHTAEPDELGAVRETLASAKPTTFMAVSKKGGVPGLNIARTISTARATCKSSSSKLTAASTRAVLIIHLHL